MKSFLKCLALMLSASFLCASLTEVRVGYWSLSDSFLSKTYDEPGYDIHLTQSSRLFGPLHLYMAVGYLKKGGRSQEDQTRTSLIEVPLSLGLQPIFPLSDQMEAYFTVGPRYTFVHTTNPSAFVPEVLRQHALGAFANVGLYYKLGGGFVVDLFAEYANTRVKMCQPIYGSRSEKRQVGGVSLGLGLGYSF